MTNVTISIKSLAQDCQLFIIPFNDSPPQIKNYPPAMVGSIFPKVVTFDTSNYFIIPLSNYYTVNIWKITSIAPGQAPDSWFVFDKTGNIINSFIKNFKCTEILFGPEGFIVKVINANFWEKYKYWIISLLILLIIIVGVGMGLVFWKYKN